MLLERKCNRNVCPLKSSKKLRCMAAVVLFVRQGELA